MLYALLTIIIFLQVCIFLNLLQYRSEVELNETYSNIRLKEIVTLLEHKDATT